jgi:hypothetical protein
MAAKIELTLKSARHFLEHYEENEADQSLEDPITLLNQEEMFLQCKCLLESFKCKQLCIQTILIEIPIICRTLNIVRELSAPYMASETSCASSIWFYEVMSIPTIVKITNTSDFVTRLKNRNSTYPEIINAAMILTENSTHCVLKHGIGKHISSYLITGIPGFFSYEADLAVWAMTMIHILTKANISDWMHQELQRIKKMEQLVYGQSEASWCHYKELILTNDFRRIFITSCKTLPAWCQCPHLNKALLAIWIQIDRLDTEKLLQLRDAALIELYGRQFKNKEFLRFGFGNLHVVVQQLLSSISVELHVTLAQTLENFMIKLKKINTRSIFIEDNALLPQKIDSLFYNLNSDKLCQFFSNLRPDIPPLTYKSWVQSLCVAIASPKSTGRNKTNHRDAYQEACEQLKLYVLRQTKIKARYHVINFMNQSMTISHAGLPFRFGVQHVNQYNAKYHCDLKKEFALNELGFSKIACMCKKCPFYGQKLLEGDYPENKHFIRRGSVAEHSLALNNIIMEVAMTNPNASLLTLLQNVLQEMVAFSKMNQLFHLFADFESDFKSPYIRMLSGIDVYLNNNYSMEMQEYIRNKNQQIMSLLMDAKTPIEWETFEKTVNNLRSIQEPGFPM